MRFMALRSGARLRRMDSIQSAKRHLRVICHSGYVDVGFRMVWVDLIRELSSARPRVPVLIGTSGDELSYRDIEIGCGCVHFETHESLAAFQQTLLICFPLRTIWFAIGLKEWFILINLLRDDLPCKIPDRT